MRNTRTFATGLTLALTLALAVGLTGCGGSTSYQGGTTPAAPSAGTSQAGATTMVEKDFQFSPATLTVKIGDKVTFDNQDTTAHQVDVDGTDLGVQQPGASVEWSAAKTGTFAVKCIIHPSMTAQIVVQ